jgi:hypothetical protein
MSYDPNNHYWIVADDDTQVHASARAFLAAIGAHADVVLAVE